MKEIKYKCEICNKEVIIGKDKIKSWIRFEGDFTLELYYEGIEGIRRDKLRYKEIDLCNYKCLQKFYDKITSLKISEEL